MIGVVQIVVRTNASCVAGLLGGVAEFGESVGVGAVAFQGALISASLKSVGVDSLQGVILYAMLDLFVQACDANTHSALDNVAGGVHVSSNTCDEGSGGNEGTHFDMFWL